MCKHFFLSYIVKHHRDRTKRRLNHCRISKFSELLDNRSLSFGNVFLAYSIGHLSSNYLSKYWVIQQSRYLNPYNLFSVRWINSSWVGPISTFLVTIYFVLLTFIHSLQFLHSILVNISPPMAIPFWSFNPLWIYSQNTNWIWRE